MKSRAGTCLLVGLICGALVAAVEWNGEATRAIITVCVLGALGYLAGSVIRTPR
jgi:uncharacterized membrane protein YeaQ/YmgE (transglycosylase-associated protein family)